MKTKGRVCAQRKFAQGAYIPPNHNNNNNTITACTTNVQIVPGKEEKNIVYHNLSARSLLDLVAFNSLHVHRQPVVVLERLAETSKEPNASATPSEPKSSPEKSMPKQLQVSSPEQKKATPPATPLKKHRPPKPTLGNFTMSLRSKSRVVGKRLKRQSMRHRPDLKKRVEIMLKRKREDSDEDERPLKYLKNVSKSTAVPTTVQTDKPARTTRASAEKPLPTPTPETRTRSDPSKRTTSERTPETRKKTPQKQVQRVAGGQLNRVTTEPRVTNGPRVTDGPRPLPVDKGAETPKTAAVDVERPSATENSAKVPTVASNSSSTRRANLPKTPEKDIIIKAFVPLEALPDITNKHTKKLSDKNGAVAPYNNTKGKTTEPLVVEDDDYGHLASVPNQYYGRKGIHKWIDSAVEPEGTSIVCPIENYMNLRDANYAPNDVKEQFCGSCSSCQRLLKIDKLSKLMQIPDRPAGDIYEFDAEREATDSGPLAYRKRGESRSSDAAGSSNERSKYFDLLPPENPYILRLRMVEVPNKQNQNQKILRANLVPKSKDIQREDIYLAEHEDLVDGLIRFMTDTVSEPLNHTSVLERPGPSGLQNEATGPSSKLPRTRQSNPSLEIETSTGKNKSRVSSSHKTPALEEAPIRSKPTRNSSQNTLGLNRLENEASAANSKPNSKTVNVQNDTKESREKVVTQNCQNKMKDSAQSKGQVKSTKEQIKNIKDAMPKRALGEVVEAPTFHLSEAEFTDPIAFFEKILSVAAKFGLCKVVAPPSFKPACFVNESIKFKVTNQYIARLYSRWGPAAREMTAIKAYLATQNVQFTRAPLREGLELNLPKLYHIVQRNGGLKQVIEKKRWSRVAEEMKLTKGANPEKALDQIYVKYLLPYDILSNQERQQIMKSVEKFWNKKNQKLLDWANNPLHRQKKLLGESESDSSDDDDDEAEESPEVADALLQAEDCVMQGRQMGLTSFKKVAAKAMEVNFPDSATPTTRELETEYWRLVLLGTEHVCVNSASIDTGDCGCGFTRNKAEPFGQHPWNLKMLSENPLNVLTSLGAVLGVTVPTFHLGMAFSTSCWHRDPHMLPWVEYMHNGPAKIWYGIPNEQSANFRKAVETLCPTSCQNKSIWLPSDITMIPPNLLREHHVSLSRVEQKPGEFIIVLPMAYSCSISTGYTESESVYFATKSWLKTIHQVFQELRDSCEPTTFSLEQLLIALAQDPRVPLSVLQQVHASLSTIVDEELRHRNQLAARGVQSRASDQAKNQRGTWNVREQDECEICRSTLYLSKVTGLIDKKSSVCVQHALRLLEMPKNKDLEVSDLEFVVFYTENELSQIMTAVQKRLTH